MTGLRAVAALMVLLSHSLGSGGGTALGASTRCLDVFFVLSGFLITALLLGQTHLRIHLYLTGFYIQRALRVLPALLVFLGFVVFAAATFAPHQLSGPTWGQVVPTCLYYLNWHTIATGVPPGGGMLLNAWTLSIEEQFYLVWPLVLLLLLRFGSRRIAVVVLLVGAVACTGWTAWLSTHGATAARIEYGSDTRGVGLLLGCAAAIARSEGWLPIVRGRFGLLGIAGLALLFLFPVTIVASAPLASLAALVVILWVADAERAPILDHPVLVAVGTVSYGLYLWQGPVLKMLQVDVAPGPLLLIAGCLVLAAPVCLSYWLVERPIWRLRTRLRRSARRAPVPVPRPLLPEATPTG
ncbi:MAG: acyltransferase [Candidatus Dormiibacterota bacterium]